MGKPEAHMMIIGQNPGEVEDEQGKPFVGPSGHLLRLMADAAGIPPHEIFRTNAVRCLSPGNRKPKREEIEACRDYLLAEIRQVNPRVIVTLGEVPLSSLYAMAPSEDYEWTLAGWEDECQTKLAEWGEKVNVWQVRKEAGEKKIGRQPGKPRMPAKPKKPKPATTALKDIAGHTIIQADTGIPLVPSYHPAFLMRGHWEYIELVVSHLEKATRIMYDEQQVEKLGEYTVITTLDQLEALRDYLISDEVPVIWYDTETTGLSWKDDELICISFSGRKGEGFVVPILYNDEGRLVEPDVFPAWAENLEAFKQCLRDIFESDKPKGGHNQLFDRRMLERCEDDVFIRAATTFGFKLKGPFIDTELDHHATAESLPHNMTAVLAQHTGMPYYEQDVKGKKKDMAHVPDSKLWLYSAADADGLPRIHEALRPITEDEGTSWVLDNVTMPMLEVCRDIEKRGFPIDEEYFWRLNDFYLARIEEAEERLWQLTPQRQRGWKYNHAATLRKVLFEELKLPQTRFKTASGHGCQDCEDGLCFEHDSTAKNALEELVLQDNHHPVIDVIIDLKGLTKRQSGYLAGGTGGWTKFFEPDQRIHPSMKISRTDTGRLASEEPNCQNQPNYVHIHGLDDECSDSKCKHHYANAFGINTENAFHDLVKAGPGKGIMNVDWSQLEVWVLAYRLLEDTGDNTLLEVLESGVDIHLFMARKMWPEIDPELDDKTWKATHPDLRRRAKTAVFGIGYGLTEQGFMNREHCTLEEAEEVISRYKKIVAGLPVFFKMIRKALYERGYVENIFGRRRHIKYLSVLKAMGQIGELEGAIRQAINFPIQSGGSDLHSMASYQTFKNESLRQRGCGIILSIHDSLTFEFDYPSEEYAKQTAWIIKDLWTKIAWETIKPNGEPLHWRVPCEVEWGKTWGSPDMKLNRDGEIEVLRSHL